MYSIIDIETTGHSSKITEISIFIFDGEKVINEFTSLVNPECSIPPFITNLTGISNAMVENAPKFFEIAKKVNKITQDTIFVAHNVNFDYNIIHKEFKDLGFDFKRKKLCTIRLSRKLIPGLKSYSLGNLCSSRNIEINGRHRARGDAEATTILFKQLIDLDSTEEVFRSFLNPRSRNATLPPLVSKELIDNLSTKTGVYYFKNDKGEIIYVGKANNIKQRVLSHFYNKAKKEVQMCLETAYISFTETGNELTALLLESSEIKHIFPKYNRAQRRTQESIGLFSYEDRDGIVHLAINKLKYITNPLMKFHSTTESRNFLEKLCEEFELCPKYCHLQSNVSSCFHYQLKQCNGICRNEEPIELYNLRVQNAINSICYQNQNFVIKENGRTTSEKAYILVVNGIYKGFGYMNKKEKLNSLNDYFNIIEHRADNSDTRRILNSYLKKDRENITILNDEVLEKESLNLFASHN